MENENLGIEFYRNYIGIEKLLRVTEHKWREAEFEFIDLIDNEWCFNHCEPSDIKPHLKLPEDLTDDEWLWVFGFENENMVSIKHDIDYINLYDDDNEHDIAVFEVFSGQFSLEDGGRYWDIQEILNRLYSLHSHPKAKE